MGGHQTLFPSGPQCSSRRWRLTLESSQSGRRWTLLPACMAGCLQVCTQAWKEGSWLGRARLGGDGQVCAGAQVHKWHEYWGGPAASPAGHLPTLPHRAHIHRCTDELPELEALETELGIQPDPAVRMSLCLVCLQHGAHYGMDGGLCAAGVDNSAVMCICIAPPPADCQCDGGACSRQPQQPGGGCAAAHAGHGRVCRHAGRCCPCRRFGGA